MKAFRITVLLVLASLAQPGLVRAEAGPGQGKAQGQGQDPGQGHRPHHPPPQAIEACANKSAGAACSFAGRNGEQRSGTCFQPGKRNEAGAGAQSPATPLPLACRPERPRQGAGNPAPNPGS